MANEQNLKPFTGADDPRRANGAPKGSIHLSTRIQKMLNDDDFNVEHVIGGEKFEFKGNPADAIIKTAIIKARNGDKQWADWLAQHGYGTKNIVEVEDKRTSILERFGIHADETTETKKSTPS